MALSKVSKDMLEKRRTLLKEFNEIRKRNQSLVEASKKRRIELRGSETDRFSESQRPAEDETEETVEFLIKEEIIVLEEED